MRRRTITFVFSPGWIYTVRFSSSVCYPFFFLQKHLSGSQKSSQPPARAMAHDAGGVGSTGDVTSLHCRPASKTRPL
ncbi:hypothetical protein LX36DRAFT_358082 [Colletotrichum falcatum]|nr:hypothetical protein LX36DRAFT_358082 [Colletotrichum falcatum]